MKYIKAFERAYLKQQGLVDDGKNWDTYGVNGELKLLHENDSCWVILHSVDEPEFNAEFVNVISKVTGRMESVEC